MARKPAERIEKKADKEKNDKTPPPEAPPAATQAKSRGKGVITRADGREVIRLFLYFDVDVAKGMKRHCFENETDMSKYVNELVAGDLNVPLPAQASVG